MKLKHKTKLKQKPKTLSLVIFEGYKETTSLSLKLVNKMKELKLYPLLFSISLVLRVSKIDVLFIPGRNNI